MVARVPETPSSRLVSSTWGGGLSRPHSQRHLESVTWKHIAKHRQYTWHHVRQCASQGRKCVVNASAESIVVPQEDIVPHSLRLKYGDRYVRYVSFISMEWNVWFVTSSWLAVRESEPACSGRLTNNPKGDRHG